MCIVLYRLVDMFRPLCPNRIQGAFVTILPHDNARMHCTRGAVFWEVLTNSGRGYFYTLFSWCMRFFMDSYIIKNKEEFLNIIDITEEELKKVLKDKAKAYHKFKVINKKRNSLRTIHGIVLNSDIYRMQRNLQKYIFNNFYFPSNVYGFIKHKNYIDYLVPHCTNVGKKYFLRLDIKNFFDTISVDQLQECLSYYFDEKCDDNEKRFIIDSIISIVTINDKLIQGAITSPSLSNLVFRRLDIRIERFCENNNVVYTRYADDLLFSSYDETAHKNYFLNMISSILKSYGFRLNYDKTLKMYDELSINGYVIGKDIRLSRKKYEAVNYVLFYLEKNNTSNPMSRSFKYTLINLLAGYRSLFIQVLRNTNDEKRKTALKKKISRIEKGIDQLIETNDSTNMAKKTNETKILSEIYYRKK